MGNNKKIYKTGNIAAAIFMVLTLLWLTISTPFVYSAQQQQDISSQTNPAGSETPDTDDPANPFSNTTEEKAESNSGSLSEYLHHTTELTHLTGSLHQHNCSHDVAVYVAFHGELLCPPPNFILA